MEQKESKVCLVCHRPFTNRKSYRSRGQWERVKYCSDRCRRKESPVEKR